MSKVEKSRRFDGKVRKEKAITLIALVITIIVLLILAGVTIAALSGDNGILTQASLASLETKFSNYKEEVELYKTNKLMQNQNFESESLTAGQTDLNYNTKEEGETGNIKTVITGLEDKYISRFEVIKGELLIKTKNKTEIKAAQNVGIQVNPYDITEDGELLSSDGNLLLVDEQGTLTLPDSVTKIGYGAFSGVEGLKKIIIPSSVKEIGAYAFSNNKTLETVVIQGNLEKIGEYAFDVASNLKEINLPDSISDIGMRAFRGTNISKVKVPKNVKIIKEGVFNIQSLNEVILQEGLNEILSEGFKSNRITELKFPSTLSEISGYAFSNCSSLENFDLENNDYFSYESGILTQKETNSIVFISSKKLSSNNIFEIPEGITSFSVNVSNYTNIKNLVIPSTLSSIVVECLPTSIENIKVNNGNSTFLVNDEYKILYTKSNVLNACYSKEKEIDLPEGMISLGALSFKFATNAEIINLPDSLKSIGDRVFSECYNVKTIYIGQNVSDINPRFKWTNYSGTVVVDNDYYVVKDNVLYKKDSNTGKCTTLVRVLNEINGTMQISSEVKSIGYDAFYGQRKMTEIVIPEGVETISQSFNYCSILKKVEIPSTVKSISSTCFADATNNLEEIIIHNKENSISGAPWGAVKGMKVVKWVG